ncbi:MAG: hypothetical protein PHG85_01745 [Candidatus Altiarchaeota archaeon]|nr:hypothetical protein [Candidatus Altiarchaeota archaeon]
MMSKGVNTGIMFVFLILTLALTHPIFRDIDNIGARDWDTVEQHSEAARISLLEYHQPPLWNPWMNGGVPLLADPTSDILTPLYLLNIVFGTIYGLKLQIVAWYMVGFAGTYVLCRLLGLPEVSSMIGAATFMLSSYHSLHWTSGHYGFCAVAALIPWMFYFHIKAKNKPVNAVFAGIALAMGIFAGGMHILLLVMTGLFFYAVATRSLRVFVTSVVSCALFSAVKLLPAVEYLSEFPRQMRPLWCQGLGMWWGYSLEHLYYGLVGSYQLSGVWYTNFHSSIWDEYGVYIGPIGLILALAGILWRWRQNRGLLVFGLLGLSIAVGTDQANNPIWTVLQNLPVYSSLRVPSRWMLLALFALSVFAAYGASLLEAKKKKILVSLVFLALAADMIRVDYLPFTEAFVLKPILMEKGPFIQVASTLHPGMIYGQVYQLTLANIGDINHKNSLRALSCGAKNAVPYGFIPQYTFLMNRSELLLNGIYRGEAYLNYRGEASFTYWSPNRILVNVSTKNPNSLIINQNYDKGWMGSNYSRSILWREVPAGDSTVTFTYLPVSFVIGSLISVLSALVLYVHLRKKRPKHRKR